MDSERNTEHERHERRMRAAALYVGNVDTANLGEAVSRFMQAEIDWFNSIPRDARAIPLTRAA